MERKAYTVEVFKTDKRTKMGMRLVKKVDHESDTLENLEHLYKTTYFARDGFVVDIFETYVTVRNMMTGKEVKERYDTPRSCSVANESYWSM